MLHEGAYISFLMDVEIECNFFLCHPFAIWWKNLKILIVSACMFISNCLHLLLHLFQFQILVVLHALLKKSVENLQTCTKAGLITMLLDRISTYDDDMIAG